MATKYDIPDTYLDEYTSYQNLFPVGAAGRALIPAGSLLSNSSGVTYTYTDGNDLFSQLQTVLADYLVTASDWNSLETTIDEKLQVIALGGLPY